MRKRLTELFVVALLAVGLSLGAMYVMAAFSSITSGPVKNSGYQTQYFREARGVQIDFAADIPATVGSYITVAEIEPEDVLIGAVMHYAGMATVPLDASANFTIASTTGTAIISTSTGLVDGSTVILYFYDVDNTR